MYSVFLTGLEFHGYHGVSDEERVSGHRFSVSVRLEVEGSADITDAVQDTADYGQVASCVLKVQTSEQCKTVERLARLMAEALLLEFALAKEVEIELSKIHPPMPYVAEEAGVVLTLAR